MIPYVRYAQVASMCCGTLLLATGADFASAQLMRSTQMPGRAPTDIRVGNPEQGRLIARATCAACHGLRGNAPSTRVPKLAGQRPAYLYRQLWNFRTGARRSPVMSAIVARLSDRDMANAASYYALQLRRPDPPTRDGHSADGKRIFLTGIPGSIPACIACHQPPAGQDTGSMAGGMMRGMMGGRGMGAMRGRGPMTPATARSAPLLAGQHAPYLIQQLNRFADDKRPSPVMGPIAARMDESDRIAVAAYLSENSAGYE